MVCVCSRYASQSAPSFAQGSSFYRKPLEDLQDLQGPHMRVSDCPQPGPLPQIAFSQLTGWKKPQASRDDGSCADLFSRYSHLSSTARHKESKGTLGDRASTSAPRLPIFDNFKLSFPGQEAAIGLVLEPSLDRDVRRGVSKRSERIESSVLSLKINSSFT